MTDQNPPMTAEQAEKMLRLAENAEFLAHAALLKAARDHAYSGDEEFVAALCDAADEWQKTRDEVALAQHESDRANGMAP